MIALGRNQIDRAETMMLEAIAVADQQRAVVFQVRSARCLVEMFSGSTRVNDGRRQLERALSRIPVDTPLAEVQIARKLLE
jgi:hypothetical protein